jgi:hypothetical protein
MGLTNKTHGFDNSIVFNTKMTASPIYLASQNPTRLRWFPMVHVSGHHSHPTAPRRGQMESLLLAISVIPWPP